MSSGPSIDIFSDYLSKIYNLPRESSTTDGQDPGNLLSDSSVKPTEQIKNEQIQFDSVHLPKDRDVIPKTAPAVFNSDGVKTSIRLLKPVNEPRGDSIQARSTLFQNGQLDKPADVKMKQPEECGSPNVKKSQSYGVSRRVPTVDQVLQNKMDVLSPVSARRRISGSGLNSQECSSKTESLFATLDDSNCSLREELLSSSYDQGPVRTFGRGELDGPLSQSTLKSALEPANILMGTLDVKNSEAVLDDITEVWKSVVSEDATNDKTELWTTATEDRDCIKEVQDDDVEDDFFKQTTTKTVGEMQRILQREYTSDSPRKTRAIPKLEDATVPDKLLQNDDGALTESVLKIRKSSTLTPASVSLLVGLKDQSDGGTRRRNLSPPRDIETKISTSIHTASQSPTVKAKAKKKIESIIAIKDDKLAKGELLCKYAPCRKEIEEKIEDDLVDENQTTVVSPRLKKASSVFNLNPHVLQKIRDKPKNEGSISSVKPSTAKITKKPTNDGQINLDSESLNSGGVKSFTEQITTEKDTVVNKLFETPHPIKKVDTVRAIRHIVKTKARLKVDLPKQTLPQLKCKAECQSLTFKIRHKENHKDKKSKDIQQIKLERKGEQTHEKSKDIQQIKLEHKGEHTHEKSKGKQHIKLEHKGKNAYEKSKGIHLNNLEHKEKHADEKSKGVQKIKREHKEVLKSKHEIKKEHKEKHSVESSKNLHQSRLEHRKKHFDGKKESNDAPKTINIVNHFEPYNPQIEIKDSPPRKRHKSDRTPTSIKEKEERKVKSDEKHSRKRKHDSIPCKSVSSPIKFKIPKNEVSSSSKLKIPKKGGGEPQEKVKGFAPNRFLLNENIKTLSVGESGSALLESILSEIKGDSSKAIEMFEKIDSKQNKMANNKRYTANEDKERSDIVHEGWDQVKSATDDKERKKLSEHKFGNPVPNHPNNNLTYHGYKRYKSRWQTDSYKIPKPFKAFWDSSKKRPMYRLTDGSPKPLPGYRFQQLPNVDEDEFNDEENDKKIKLGEFVTLMKTVMYNKKAKKEAKGGDRKAMDEFETFLGHYKAGQEETTLFLEFYQKQGQVELEGWQAVQIMDLENQFSTYSGYYGDTEELRCETCNKKHTFAL